MFARFLNILSFHATNLLIWDAETEIAGKQEDYYDPLFTYREHDEASYFISDEPEGRAADIDPSGAGEGKKAQWF